MKISLYDRPPVLDTAGDFDDSDLLQSFSQAAREFNRPWSFTDPLREGTANLVQSIFGTSNMENERLQSLVGLNDEQFIEAVRDGRVQRDEWALGKMPREQRDAIIKGRIAQRNMWQDNVNQAVDFIKPTHHAQPDSWLGNAGYKTLEAIPGIATALGEAAALGIPAAVGINTLTGSNSTTEKVYANLRAQGYPVNEARAMALNPFSQLGDLGIKGTTNALTLYALGKPYPGIESGISPIAHTLRNIGTAMGISGTGAAGNEALTNYRSDKENTLAGLAQIGAGAAAATGVMGLIGAGLRAKQLWNAQKEYNANRPINAEWRDITPPDDPNGLGSGNNPNTPPNSPFGGADIVTVPANNALPQGTLQLPEFTSRNIAARLNKAVVQRGFTPIANDFQPNALARQIAAYVGNGFMSQEDALNMLQEGGLSPEQAQGFLDSGINEILEQTKLPDTPKQPTEIIIDRIANHPNIPMYRRGFEDYANLDETYSDFGGDNSSPLQDFPDTYTYSPSPLPTPADFLADIKAKKRQLGYDIRRQEKELGVDRQKSTDTDALERKYQRQADKANEVKSIMDVFNFGRNVASASNQRDYAQRENAHNKAIDELYTKPTSPTPRVTAFSDLEPYYLDDSYSDYKGGDNSAAWEDIPDTHLPDSTPQAPKVTAFSFSPNINNPETSHFKPNPQRPNAGSLKPDLQRPSVIQGTDGLMDFLTPPQPKPQADGITFDEALRKVAEKLQQDESKYPGTMHDFKNLWSLMGQFPKDIQDKIYNYLNKNKILRTIDPYDGRYLYIINNHQALKDILQKSESAQSEINTPRVTALYETSTDLLNFSNGMSDKERKNIITSNVEKLRLMTDNKARHAALDKLDLTTLMSMPAGNTIIPKSFAVRGYDEVKAWLYDRIIDAVMGKPEPPDPNKTDGIAEDLKNIASTKPQPQTQEAVTIPTLKSDTPSNATLPDLEDSYTGIKKYEKNAMAESNKKALALFPDEQTMRDRLSNMHTPMLRAMLGLTGSGLKKDDFINAIVDEVMRKKNKPIPDGARLKAGEFSVPGINGTWTVKPNGAGNVFHIENKDIPRSFMIYDVKDNYFLNTLGGEAIDKAQAYFREHAKDFYDTGQGDNQQSQTAPQVQQQKPETPKKPDKSKLMPLGNDNPDEISEQNLDILRSLPTDDSRKKLLNAQSMTTDDLKRMREYIMRKYKVGMGVQGKRNDIINSIVKFIRKDPKAWENIASQIPINPDTQTDTIQPQKQEQERKPDTQGNNAPVIEFSGSEEHPLWTVTVNRKRYFVRPYDLSVPKFREWMIFPVGEPSNDERMMYDAYLDVAHFTELSPNDDRRNTSNTPAVVEAIRDKLTELYREKYGETYSDKQAKKEAEKEQNSPIRVKTDSSQPEPQTQKSPEHQTSSRNDAIQSDSPVVRLAKIVQSRITQHKTFNNKDLNEWAAQEFGGTLGEGTYDQKKAYDAMEMGINMFIEDWGINPQNGGKYNSVFHLQDIIKRILDVIPTQTNRTPDQVKFQQFSTPPTLAYLVNWLANINKGNTVLEPSAGTGNLAVFAKNAGANLILNDYSESGLRADILDDLNWGKVYREDALHLADILIPKLDTLPDRVLMNPPFSAAGKQGTANSNQNGFRHVEQALQLLRHGGRLVAILGAGRDGTASSVKTWLKHIGKMYNVRALITSGGKAYQKYGTTFSNAIVVIDNTGETPKAGTLEYSFNGDFSDNEAVKNLFDALSSIRNDIQGGYESQSDNDSTPPKPEPTKPTPDTKINSDITFDEALKKMAEIIYSQYSQSPNDFYDVTPVWDFTNTLPKDLNLKLGEYLQKNNIMVADRRDGFDIPPEQRGKVFYSVKNYQGLMDILQKGSDTQSSSEPKDTPTPETQKADNQKYSGKRIIPDGAVLKEGSFTAKGHIHKEARYKVKPVKRQWLSGNETVDALEITSTLEPSFVYDPKYDSFAHDGYASAGEELKPYVEKAFREHMHEFYELPQSTQAQTNDDISDTSKEALKAESTFAQAENTPTQEQESTETDTQNEPEKEAIPAPEKVSITRKSSKQINAERKKLREQNEDNSIQSTYSPTIITQGAKHHPADLVESTVMRSVAIPEVSEKPNIPQFIIDEGRLSDAQMEAVTLAVNSFSHILPNGVRRGFFIGDGTGVGKGREISGIIIDTLSRGAGNGKAVWISDKHSLIKDAIRDWQGLGNDSKDIFPQERFDAKQPIDRKKGILFTAYSHMASKFRIEQLKKWLGENFDGIIVLDEAHNANHVLGLDAASRAKNTRDFIKAFPKARVLYVSATGATELDNLAMLDRLGLWGYEDAPFESAQAFVNQVSKGGIAAMEVAARDMKAMGLFVARSLSMRAGPHGGNEDVTFRTLEYTLNDDMVEIYDELVSIWQMIEQNMPAVMIARGYDPKDGKSAGRWKSAFWGAHQRFFNQIITSMQTDSVIRDMRKQLDAGNSVVIQLTNTMEANLNKAIQKGANDDGEYDLSPKDTLIQLVMDLFNPRVVEYVTDDEGNEIVQDVVDSHGKPILSQEVIRMRDNMINTVNSINRFPDSPIDKILNFFGHDNVAEITGRSKRPRTVIDKKTGKKSNLETGRTDKVKAGEVEDFNNGKRRILIFSEKGGTGASYHASNDIPNKQKRIHYLLQAGWRADKAIQGLGRSHRSNEAHKPEYVLVTTDIPGQKRFISTIARRLAQLGALSTGERRSTSNGLFSESDNLEAGYVLTALSRFFHNLLAPLDSNYNPYPELAPDDVLKQLGFKQEKLKDVSITDFLNRLLAMSIDLQKKVFARFQQEINTVQEEYQANGIDIDAPTENVKASSINVIQEQRILQSKEFGTDTNYVKLEITRPMNPVTWQDIDTLMKNGVDIEFYTLQSGQIVAAVKASKKGFDPMTSHFYDKYKLIQPDRRKVEYGVRDSVLDNSDPNQKRKFTRIDVKTAQAIWMTQTDELPETYTSTAHLITGAMLPAWGLIEGHPKIWRVTTDDGREFLGRLIPGEQLQKILNALNVKYEGKKYDADSLKKALDKRGMIATLLNKAKLKFSRVSGEKLLEIIPADQWMARSLKRGSAITMIINGKERFFLPKNNDELLNKTLETYPVVGEPVQIDDADEIIAEGTDIINSSIPDSSHLHIIHPSFWHFINDPDDNPLIHKSKTPMIDPESEERYQKSKVADSSKSAWQHVKDFCSQLYRGRHDIPELANNKGNIDDFMLRANELLRALKRERQANVHEAEKELRIILLGSSTNDRMSPDDFDLFQRAMELRDLHETRGKDINARMPWGLNPKTLYDFDARDPLDENYDNVMAQVRKNPRVQEAMRIADTLMDDIRKKLVEAADRLGLFDVRDRLKRPHYFRHLVLEYYNMQRSGKPHPTFKNPDRRGYMKHREGSDKDISSNWILAMGEVFTRMFDDIKILDTLFKLRKEYDRIEEIKQQALAHNMEHALANIMKDLQDVPDELRKSKAEKKLRVILNTTQARGMTRLFNLAKKGDLPVGNSHEWEELVSRMAEAGQLDNLFQEEQEILSRYIGWLSGLAESSSARKAAKTFLTGIKSRLSALKKTAGNDYVDWKDLIPEGYTIWSPTDSRLVFSASTLPEHLIKIAMENIDTLLEADASDIGKMIQAGGDKQLWVIPENLADALDNIGKSQPIGAFGQFMTKFMGAFKQWVTIGPVNGRIFKYNYRNFFGDLEAVLQGNPGALYYFKQAAEELTKIMFKGGIATGTLAEFQKRGGGLTTEAMTELERPDRIKQFANLYEQKKSMNPLKWGLKAFRAYIDLATTVTNFRESILRYAAFLSYIDLIKENNGVPPFYGMSKPREVKAVGDNIFDIAFKLANENLGAYDQISANTQWLRDNNFVSFLSWVEVNASRYIRNLISIWTGNSYLEWWIKKHGQKFIDNLIGNGSAGNGNGGNNEPPKGNNGGDFADDDGDNEFRKLFRKLAKKSGVGALRLAITLAMAAPFYFLAKLWNKLMGADDNDPNLNDRNGVSLYLGKNAYTGENLYMPDIGSAWDALRTFGVDNLLAGDVRDLLDGRTSFGQVAVNILDGPVSKFVSNANPFGKLIIEGFFGKRAFPSALNPTPIRDKGKFVAQSFGLDWYYDFLTGKPHKPFYDFASSIVNTANQDQSAYFYMLSRRKQFEEYVLGKSSDFFTQTRRGEALRNAKRAADLGDRKSLRKFLREFYRAGGTEQGLKISARTMEPLYGLNDEDEARFIRWLPKEERKILRRAMRYAERMKAKLGVWD